MAEIWGTVVAGVGVAISAAGTAYALSQSSPSYPNPKKFIPVNIPQTAAMAKAADIAGYKLSDADFAARFPNLVAGREFSINDALGNLEGKTSKTVSDALEKSGVATGNLGDNPFKQAFELGMPILSKEQRDRTYFQRLLADNPQRQFGLSGGDVAKIAVANVGSQNNYNQGVYGSRINQYNAQVAQNAQTIGAITSGAPQVVSIGQQLYNNFTNPYLNYDYFKSAQPNSYPPVDWAHSGSLGG
jgi:hypothetical protein